LCAQIEKTKKTRKTRELFKKIKRILENVTKMSAIKDKNNIDKKEEKKVSE